MSSETERLHEKAAEERWLAARRQVVTSTEVAALMGIPGAYGSRMGIFLEKQGKAERGETPDWMEWGKRIQQATLIGYAEREGVPLELVDEFDFRRSSTCQYLGASLDARWQTRDLRCVDAKNIGFADPEEWGDEYTDEFPARYVAQGHVQMEVTGTAVFDLAVLFGGRKLAIYRAQRDEEIIAACREVATRFMEQHVQRDIPPPVDASDEWTRFLNSRKQRYERYLEIGAMEPAAAAEAARWVERLQKAKEAKDAIEMEEQLAANHVRAIIGENAGLIGPFGRLHYKQNKPKTLFDAGGYIAHLEGLLGVAGIGLDDLSKVRSAKFTSTVPGARPLSPKWTKTAKEE